MHPCLLPVPWRLDLRVRPLRPILAPTARSRSLGHVLYIRTQNLLFCNILKAFAFNLLKMQKLLPILSLVFVLTATPVIASHGNDKNSSEENCDTDASWKNHGSYVSCVAHEHEGGAAVSAAAQSDIGKKSDNDEVETSPSPSVSPSPSPEVSPSPSPEVSPTPSVSPTPQAS